MYPVVGDRGGVSLYIRNDLQFRVLKKDTEKEWFLVDIVARTKLLVGISYRCEKKFSKDVYCEWLLEELASLKRLEVDCIITGDFNIDLSTETKHSMELIDRMKSINLKLSSPPEPTRVFKGSKSCFDHIYSNLPESLKNYQTSITDHFFRSSRNACWSEYQKNQHSFQRLQESQERRQSLSICLY